MTEPREKDGGVGFEVRGSSPEALSYPEPEARSSKPSSSPPSPNPTPHTPNLLPASDRAVLVELLRSVYLTGRQREALGRLLGVVAGGRGLRPRDESVEALDALRSTLLGPCGAK